MSDLKPGTRVIIRMAQNNVVPWGIQFEATYGGGPSGPGDVLKFDVGGTELRLSACSEEFVGFWTLEPRP